MSLFLLGFSLFLFNLDGVPCCDVWPDDERLPVVTLLGHGGPWRYAVTMEVV